MFKIATNLDDLVKVFVVRAIVFVEEQGVSYNVEHDSYDIAATHILGELDGEPFGAGRIRIVNDFAKLERIAIRKSYRGKGLGHKLMDFMLSVAKSMGAKKLKLHAQTHLVNFYKKHGFEIFGEMFKEADINHYMMILENFRPR